MSLATFQFWAVISNIAFYCAIFVLSIAPIPEFCDDFLPFSRIKGVTVSFNMKSSTVESRKS